jgi:hypothetical protein
MMRNLPTAPLSTAACAGGRGFRARLHHLAEHFVEFDDGVAHVLQPLGVNLAVGLGDKRGRAQATREAGARLYDSITRRLSAPRYSGLTIDRFTRPAPDAVAGKSPAP